MLCNCFILFREELKCHPINMITQSLVLPLLNSLLDLVAGGQREQDLGWVGQLMLVSSYKQNKCENVIPSS